MFLEALMRAWDEGDAVAPLDPRLPPAATSELLRTLAPGVIVGPDGERHRIAGGALVEEGDALVVATSGSSGEPKAAVLTHAAVDASARATTRRLGVDPSRDVWLACLPLARIGGLGVALRAVLTGTPVVIHNGFDPREVERAARRGATRVSLVATALRRMDASRYRTVLLGGAAPPDAVPANVVTTYGMTETCGGIVYDGFPLEGVDVSIARVVQPVRGGDRLPEGEILLRSPTLLRCYRDGSDPKRSDGWLATGDGGFVDHEGRLHVSGRLAEVIVTGGEKVWPAAVEEILSRHREVAEVAVTGRPDPEWGSRVVAVVVPRHPSDPPTLDDLRAFVAERSAPWAAPKTVELVRSLPRLASGKIDRSRI